MTEAIWVALIGAAVALMVEWLRRQNKAQHAKGYSLLESIDRRTIAIHDELGEHGERITALETHHADHDASWPPRHDIARRKAHRQGDTTT